MLQALPKPDHSANIALHHYVVRAVGHQVTINGNKGKLLSATNGIAVIEGIKLYFDFSEAYLAFHVGMSLTTPTRNEPTRITHLALPADQVTPIHSDCTCHIDPSKCCDQY